MGNEEQVSPQPQQGAPGQQGYYGWQYEQEQPDAMVQQPPAAPQPPVYPQRQAQPQQVPPQYPPQAQGGQPFQQIPPRYQQPIADMGSSLGLGQGMEHQYYEVPQPSQHLPQLRQARLQQLREERMRRQQRGMKPDAASVFPFRVKNQSPGARAPFPATPEQMSPSWGNGANPPSQPGAPARAPSQFSPASTPPIEVSPILPSGSLTQMGQSSPSGQLMAPGNSLQAASEASQDTGMIQRVHIRQATFILTGAFVVSRVFGLVRTLLFAFVFGAGATSDAYIQAFYIPDFIFNIVAGGALTSAFIPVFTKYMVGDNDEKTAWHVASAALNLAIAIMMVLALIAIIFAGQIIPLYNPKPALMSPQDYAVHINLIISLARIMLLQAIILGGGVIVTSVLNARQNFLLPAIGSVLYNVGIIIGLLPGVFLAYFAQRNDITAAYAATWGVVLGAALQVAIQVPGLVKVGMRYTFTFDWRHPGVIQVGRMMVPRVINAAMLYFSIFVDRFLITYLGVSFVAVAASGLVTQYYQALQILLLPLGIFGMAVSTAAFPTLAENVAKERFDRYRSIIQETLRSILFMSIPSSVGLIVLGLPIVQVLLEHGRYDLQSAVFTTFPLAGFAVGLAGLASVEILTRAFYALRDSLTPVIVSVLQFIFKIALSLILINIAIWGLQWGTFALAFSTSIAGTLEAAVLLWILNQRVGGLQLRLMANFIGRILLASLAMGAGLLILRFVLDFVFVTTHDHALGLGGSLLALIKLSIELFAGIFIYIRVARRLGIEELGPVKRVLDRLKLSWI
ncbi:MAG: murein biosynthesis integral membrane protein MurJ [Chloroflexi bacterium]|nr:MAG: murein biosynthesis integral membrane protein MurJ [Chloroflexota bacterium]